MVMKCLLHYDCVSVVDSFVGRYYRRRRCSKEGDTIING
jgi:hypothetical protein